jgi:DNA-binding response OmpR family regulator
MALSHDGFRVFLALNMNSALLQLRVFQPDLIVCHVLVSDADGWETLGRIRRVSEAPVVALVDSEDLTDRRTDPAYGADAYATEPVDVQELCAKARALLYRGPKAGGLT